MAKVFWLPILPQRYCLNLFHYLPVSSFPVCGSRMHGSIPKNGNVAEPGFAFVLVGSGEIIIDPVSVCQ